MIINKTGAGYTYGVITYHIGDRVYANDQSFYNGLYGEIIEICTEQEKGTDNEGPDIVGQFDVPVFPEDCKRIEQRFTNLYRSPETVDDLGLDYVIMAPDMLDVLYEHTGLYQHADHKYALANFDRRFTRASDGEDGILECKNCLL